ncbi:unnamed protein product, partial [Strongylus vulgaris]
MCKISLVDMPFGSMKKMEYKGKQWHDKCFCCAHCKNPIGTKSFIPKNEEVYCGSCYEEKFATRCNKCKKVKDSRVKMRNHTVQIVT